MTIELYQGDCLEILPTLAGPVDAIITDLPYGTTACKWDVVIPFEPMWAQVRRLLKKKGALVTTASQPFTSFLILSNLEWFKYELIWNRKRGFSPGLAKYRPLPSFQNIVVFAKYKTTYNPQMTEGQPYCKKTGKKYQPYGENGHHYGYKPNYISRNAGIRFPLSILEFMWAPSKMMHPTQKPIALYEYLIRTYTNEGETVLDFCMGSGTTGVACLNTKRNFIGIEKDAGYFAIAENRIKEAQQQGVLL